MRTCPVDGVRFRAKTPWHEFCSRRCLRKHISQTKPDINVRFATMADYLLIKRVAKKIGEKANVFITSAALARARSLSEARGPIPVHRQPVTPIAQSS